jgi:Mg2+-importing ATPase
MKNNLDKQPSFWSIRAADLLQQLQTTSKGLTGEEARWRYIQYGANLLKPKKRANALSLLLSQFKSPIILILIFASVLSFFLRNPVDATIISAIVLVSGLLGFWQERGATNAIGKLLSIVQIKAAVMRDGALQDISVEEIVPGDIVSFNAGDVIPGDCLVLESKDLFVDEASLTGETYPQDKISGVLPEETPLAKRTNTRSGRAHRKGDRIRQGL